MPVRLLLILALLVQPLTLSGVPRDAVTPCASDVCCTVVETVTCCGDHVVEVACGRTGGECRCGAAPVEPVESPIPRSREAKDLASIVATVTATATFVPPPAREPIGVTPPALHRTHNETRALLCIWRT